MLFGPQQASLILKGSFPTDQHCWVLSPKSTKLRDTASVGAIHRAPRFCPTVSVGAVHFGHSLDCCHPFPELLLSYAKLAGFLEISTHITGTFLSFSLSEYTLSSKCHQAFLFLLLTEGSVVQKLWGGWGEGAH